MSGVAAGSPPLTVLEVLRRAAEYFARKGVPTPRLDAEVLLAHVLGMQRIQLYVNFDRPLDPAELAAYRQVTAERGRRVPVAYITGKKEFFGLEFKVTPAVLIPRPETEVLVEQVLAWAAGGPADRQGTEMGGADGDADRPVGPCLRIADIGTGSGAIAVTLAVKLAEAEVWATDVSEAALVVARANAEAHGVAERVRFRQGNLAEPLAAAGFFDAVVSNPPYVAEKEAATLAPELAHEPHEALFAGPDGLLWYLELIRQAAPLVRQAGMFAAEIGAEQARAVSDLARATGVFRDIRVVKDYAGLDRVVVAERAADTGASTE